MNIQIPDRPLFPPHSEQEAFLFGPMDSGLNARTSAVRDVKAHHHFCQGTLLGLGLRLESLQDIPGCCKSARDAANAVSESATLQYTSSQKRLTC